MIPPILFQAIAASDVYLQMVRRLNMGNRRVYSKNQSPNKTLCVDITRMSLNHLIRLQVVWMQRSKQIWRCFYPDSSEIAPTICMRLMLKNKCT